VLLRAICQEGINDFLRQRMILLVGFVGFPTAETRSMAGM
jgi:hypothetical protein